MKKVEMIDGSTTYGLQTYINDFLEKHPNANIIDIKYQMNATGPSHYGEYHSAMIIYEEELTDET